jgi:uncharacterized protein (DUF58 family)
MISLRAFWRPSPARKDAAPPSAPATRALLRRLEVVSRRELAGALCGELRTRLRGHGMEFAEIRPYQPGDDVRAIDWNVTARSGTPHVRLFQEERSRTITLLADLSLSCTPAKRDLLLRAAALLAFAAVQNRDRLALIAFSDRVEQLIPPSGGRNHALRILHALHTLAPRGRGTNLAPPCEAALALNHRPGMIILLSDLHSELPQRLLRQVAARHDLLALLLRDPAESYPRTAGLLQLVDAESGRQRLLDLSTSAARTAVAAAWASTDANCGTTLARLGIDHATLACDRPPLPELLQLFRRRRRKG